MATLTGSEPISSENLSSVLQAAGMGREVLLAAPTVVGWNNNTNGLTGIDYPGMAGRFDKIVVETGTESIECPVPGSAALDSFGGTVSTTENYGRLHISFASDLSDYTVNRIVGIRSGGGRLLAEALASMIGGGRDGR